MIMILSRIILFLAFSFVLFQLIQRSKIKNKKSTTIITIIICLILLSLTAVFPVENLFIQFKSAESAFRYSSRGTIEYVIHGSDSCMVVYSDRSSTYNDSLLPMSEHGYQLPNYYGVKVISNEIFENGSFEVLQLAGSKNYYVRGVVILDNDNIQAVDCNGNKVFTIQTGDGRTTLFYALADTYESGYWFTINGENVVISRSAEKST